MRVLALSLLLACAPAGAQTLTRIDDASLATATQLRDRAMTKSEAYFILETLTTEVGSRMAGSPGDARAVARRRDRDDDRQARVVASTRVSASTSTSTCMPGRT